MDYPGYGDFRARREASIWQQLNRILRALLFIAAALVLVSLFIPQQKRLAQIRGEIDALDMQVRAQRTAVSRQKREVALLQNDPTYLETIARDRLDLMRDGETVFRFEARAPGKRK